MAPEEHDRRHEKKSVLAKMKDKAKRWRRRLSKKSHGKISIDNNGDSTAVLPEEKISTDDNGYSTAILPEERISADVNGDSTAVLPVERISVDDNGDSTAVHPEEKISEHLERENSGENLVPGVETEASFRFSVKEYLLQKLEPGEEDRALSEVITEAMSPRKCVKDVVTSIFFTKGRDSEEQHSLPLSSRQPLVSSGT